MTGLFNEFYKNIYGKRWTTLHESLLLPSLTVSYKEGLSTPYFLDSASICAALSLRLPDIHYINPKPVVLDACAAPGGKTLVIASKMEKGTVLLANEYSSQRRSRLSAALDKHLSLELRNRIQVSGFNAAAAARRQSERGRFAAILVDTPCSSERHVINSKAALEKWTPSRPQFLVQREWSLLSASFLLLECGGSLVYTTCSINPQENDGVAGRLLKKYSNINHLAEGFCVLDRPDFPAGEETEYGRIILPDTSEGSGPMYVARFIKKASFQ